MHLTFNTRLIFDSADDQQKLTSFMEAERELFNELSRRHFGSPKNSLKELHNKHYYSLRESTGYPSQLVIRAENDCLAAYRSTKSNKHNLDKPPLKTKLSLRLDKRICTLRGDKLRLTTLENRINTRLYMYERLETAMAKGKVCDPLLYERDGEIWVSLTIDIQVEPKPENAICGVDLGIRRYAATSEGKVFQDPVFNKRKRELRYLKRSLQARKTKSSKRHTRKIRGQEARRNRQLCHSLANKLLASTECNAIAIEDLSGIKKKKKEGIRKYQKLNKLSQVPFYMIRSILTYKAHLCGKQVITVCPSYTSQIDNKTGRKDGIRKGCRYYSVSGEVYDADVNAAINIAIRSKLPVSPNVKHGLDGQALVIKPIVC